MKTIKQQIAIDDRGKRKKEGKLCRLRSGTSTSKFPELLVIGKNKKKNTTVVKKAFEMDKVAFKQLCSILSIPEEYIASCPPSLRSANINYWLSAVPKVKKVCLLLKEKVIRGIVDLEQKARLFTNSAVIEIFEDLIKNGISVTVPNEENTQIAIFPKIVPVWQYLSSTSMHISLMFPDENLFFEGGDKKKGVFTGIHISNSEIGNHLFRMDYILHREASDSTIILALDKKRMYRPKPGTTIEKLKEDITNVIIDLPKYKEKAESLIKKARKKDIKDFKTWAELKRKKYRFNSALVRRGKEIFDGQEKNVWGACSALAKAAREKFDGERRYEMLSMLGLFLNV